MSKKKNNISVSLSKLVFILPRICQYPIPIFNFE